MPRPLPRKPEPKPGRAAPSKRLAALAPRKRETPTAADSAPVSIDEPAAGYALCAKPTAMQVATKFVVVDKQEVPAIVDGALVTRYRVALAAAYEARSIHHGLATEQGNRDNRVFGAGPPEAAIAMTIHSKAIADTFVTGHAFAVVFTEIVE